MTEEIDPLTKVGVMLAIRQIARDQAGAKTPLAALEWALARRILIPRPGASVADKQDDLVLTPHGQEIVGRFWLQREARRAAAGRGSVLSGRARAAHGGVILGEAKD